MTFARPVMIDGTVYRQHEAVRITHDLGGGTTVKAVSFDSPDGNARFSQHAHELAEGLTFEQAEEWLQTLPAFAPYDDPVQAALDEVLPILTDEQAETVIDAFPAWMPGIAYELGKRVRYEDVLYKCVQAHTSQEGWEPPNLPSLWTRIGEPADEWPEWIQPTGAQDAYSSGDKVSHNGSHWTSDTDGNVWEPGVYGWTEA